MGAGVVGNVATQKWALKNPSPLDEILIGKLVGAGLTATLLVGSHAALPEMMRDIDKVFAKHVFEPVTGFVERTLGIEDQPKRGKHKPGSFAGSVAGEKHTTGQATLG